MLKKLIVIHLLLAGVNASASEPACFKDSETFMVATYGSEYRDDENLIINKERYGSEVYFAARDKTSGTNQPITLLMQTPAKGLCKVLSTYPVAAITPIKLDKSGRPIAFSAKDQGTTSHEIIYSWDQTNGEFKPTKCTEITWIGKRMKTKSVSCASLIEQ